MNMREAILAALHRDPELVPKIAESLKEKIGDQSRAATVVQAAGALEPVLEDAVRKRPSRLGSLGLKSAHTTLTSRPGYSTTAPRVRWSYRARPRTWRNDAYERWSSDPLVK